MPIAVPKRFSRDWWLAILVVTAGISVATFLILRGRGLHPSELVLYCLAFSLFGDVVTALSMEAIVPTRVTIGPGDRQLRDDLPTELALVVSEFDGAGVGRVRIRGEIWRARWSGVGFRPMMGSSVHVINRDGLTLIVSQDFS
jgi:membrane protein implicated in regulation of membrane protease activity